MCILFINESISSLAYVVNGWIFFSEKACKSPGSIWHFDSPTQKKSKEPRRSFNFQAVKVRWNKDSFSKNHAVLNFVIQSLQLFSVVEQPSCQDLLQDLQPNASLMSRTTLWRKIDEDAIEMKRNIKEAMSTVDFIATTTDCWSARRRGSLGVTANWVDPNRATIKCATKLQINVKWNNCSLVLLFHNHLVLPNGNR